MIRRLLFLCALFSIALSAAQGLAQPAARFIEIPADTLEDKIRGGMLAQVIGNLNGLPHEFKYINEPGNVAHYTPSLPNGAHTDDDTDIEWVYLSEIARRRNVLLPADVIVATWKKHINRRIFCANRYARDLMDLGFEPPWTGNVVLNPWSEFNISGQFISESFGLMSPAMPQTAALLGLHYTRVAVNGEPAQATQLFTTMIATAFVETNMNVILDAGAAAVDPSSKIAKVLAAVRKMCRENPDDWKKTRFAMKERWQKQGGIVRERNGYELNTGCVIAALIYGHNDFVETLRTAFNFGWDADCDAATAATIVGVIKGRRWMNQQGWNIKDVYRNTTRDDMPTDETITGLENLCIESARVNIIQQRGAIPLAFTEEPGEGSVDSKNQRNDSTSLNKRVYRIRTEPPANIETLATEARQLAAVRAHFGEQTADIRTGSGITRARAAYIAICMGESEKLKEQYPAEWALAIAELNRFPAVAHDLFKSPAPRGDKLRRDAERAGLRDPNDFKPSERALQD